MINRMEMNTSNKEPTMWVDVKLPKRLWLAILLGKTIRMCFYNPVFAQGKYKRGT